MFYPKNAAIGDKGAVETPFPGRSVPHASHRIAVVVVPKDPDSELSAALEEQLMISLEREEIALTRGQAGPNAEFLVRGGFRRFRVDRPQRPVLYGNRLGGFRAECPACGGNVAGSLGAILDQWRRGEGRASPCEHCGEIHLFESWRYSPSAAPGRWALFVTQVESPELTPEGLGFLESQLGMSLTQVVSRG